jgi:hypothetical protein
MSLDNFYKLRKNFILLGLTGKMRSGSDVIVDFLKQENLDEKQMNFLNDFQKTYKDISDSEASKIRRINDFFQYDKNWIQFDVLDYRNVLLLFILNHNYNKNPEEFAENISSWICNTGNYKDEEFIDFTIEKVNGFMKAWEYINEHKLKNSDHFYKIYENQYLNTYFADNVMPKGSLEEIDKKILEVVLLQYNKL